MKKINYALLVQAERYYPVTYTIRQCGRKVVESTLLKGEDMSENQIRELHISGFFKAN